MNRGLIFAMLASLMFSFMNVLVKEASRTVGTGEIIFVRSVISVVMILLIMRVLKIKFSHKDVRLFSAALSAGSVCVLYFWRYRV